MSTPPAGVHWKWQEARRQRHAIVNSAGVFAVSTDQSHRRYDMASLVSTSLAIALLPGKGRSPSI